MTSTLFSREGTSPWTTFPTPHDQTPSTDHCPVGLHHHYLSSNYLMSSDTAHGPITIFGSFIPIIAHQNSTLLLLRKKGGFRFPSDCFPHTYVISFCVGVFSTAKRHALDASTSRMLQHLFHSAPCPPCPTVWWRSYGGEILWGFGWELSRSLFPSLYILLEDSCRSTFCIFNSQELVWGALLHFHKLPLAFLLKFKTFSSSASLISPHFPDIFNYLSNG